MKEIDLILKKGEQPVASISDDNLNFLISREFSNDKDTIKSKLDKIQSENNQGRNRISAAVLKLANKAFDKIDFLVSQANEDSRDIISETEYPRASSFGFGERGNDESKEDYIKDWEEYTQVAINNIKAIKSPFDTLHLK
jgi:hypothetical protein